MAEEKAATEREDNNSNTLIGYIVFGVVGFVVWALMSDGSSLGGLPEMVMEEPGDQIIALEQCEKEPAFINCVISYKLPQGEIVQNSFRSTFYNSDGVRLGTYTFPNTNIQPNENRV